MKTTRSVLYVTPFSLLPRSEGHRKRMAMTFDALKKAGFRIDILFIPREVQWTAEFDRTVFQHLHGLADSFFFAHGETPTAPKGDFFELDEWWPDNCDDMCRWIFANNGYEFVFCNYVFMSRVFELNPRRSLNILDTHDRFSDRKEMLLANNLPLGFFYTDKKTERTGLNRADIAIAIKSDEEKYFREELGFTKTIAIPYVEPDHSLRGDVTARRQSGPLKFGFLGSNNVVNLRSIADFTAFLDDRFIPGDDLFEFWVFGSICADIKGESPDPVRIGGTVDEAKTFYDSVDCVVIPQDFGTGLKIKTAEAISFGMPLIAHAHALEGLGEPMHAFQACIDRDDILRSMRAVAADPVLLEEMARASRAVHRKLEERVETALEDLLSGTRFDIPWLHVFVDAQTFAGSPAYRHIVGVFLSMYSAQFLICLVAKTCDAPLWVKFSRKFGRVVTDVSTVAELTELETAIFFCDAELPSGIEQSGVRSVIFSDAILMCERHEAGDAFDWRSGLGANSVHARCRPRHDGSTGKDQIFVDIFQRIPWELTVRDDLNAISMVPEVWILADASFDHTALVSFVQSCFPGNRIALFAPSAAVHETSQAKSARDSLRRAFVEKTAPFVVYSFSDALEFDFFKAWCHANSIEFRDALACFKYTPGDMALRLPAYAISDFIEKPTFPVPRKTAPRMSSGGWDQLKDFLSYADRR